VSLNHKRVDATNALFETNKGFSAGKVVGGGWHKFGAEQFGNLES
jgi:hypothetical protein